MRLYALFSALILLAMAPAGAGEPIAANLDPASRTSSEVMQTIGFDRIFVRFGQSIARSPRQQGVSDARFLEAWESVASSAFAGNELNARLEAALAGNLDVAELAGIDAFLLSPLGHRVARLEQASQTIAPERQIAVIAKGQTLYRSTSVTRQAQIEELLALSGAEMTFAMLAESVRGMALGLHLAAHGQIELPWEEIDAGVQQQLAGMQQSLIEATRGALAYTYADLSDAELAAYLGFLRHPATRKFYAVATLAVSTIIRETMFALGEDVAARLGRVDI